MRQIVEYIHKNLAYPMLSTENIAAKFHLSPPHLRRLFHRELATAPMKFVTGCRLVEQISLYCGYKFASNFTNAFIQHYGISPSAFRKNAHPNMRKK
jgi:AraC family transcriptional regulator